MTYLTAKEARALASGDDDFVRIMDRITRAVGRRQFSITVEPVKFQETLSLLKEAGYKVSTHFDNGEFHRISW